MEFNSENADKLMQAADLLFDGDSLVMAFHFAACLNGVAPNDAAAVSMLNHVIDQTKDK